MSSFLRKRAVRKALAIGVGSALALGTVGVVGAAVLKTPVPAPATADTAKASAYWAKAKASQAAAEEALRLQVPKPTGRPLQVLVVGDSLSAGWYASAEDKGFRSLVTKGLQTRANVQAHDAQFAGPARVQELAARPIPGDMDLAIVELGTFDVAKKTKPIVFQQQYSRYLDSLTAESPKAKLLCLGGWTPIGPIGDAIDRAIADECAARSGQFVSLKRAYNLESNRGPEGVKTPNGTSDDFHPNDAGHADIAREVLDHITIK